MSTWKGGQHLDDSPGNPRQSDEAYLGTVKPDVGEVLPEGLLLGTVLHVPTSRGEDPLGVARMIMARLCSATGSAFSWVWEEIRTPTS